jgi:hypothetical protein
LEETMPGANPATIPVALDIPEMKAQYAELGGYTVGYETYTQEIDPAALFVGLPDDRCQCPHWGVVTSGEITFRYADAMETFRAGDAYYARPGHLPLLSAGTSVNEFSPTAELRATMAVIEKNMAEAS